MYFIAHFKNNSVIHNTDDRTIYSYEFDIHILIEILI